MRCQNSLETTNSPPRPPNTICSSMVPEFASRYARHKETAFTLKFPFVWVV